MNVLIRADASSLIGSGHIMRCLTLAVELKKHAVAVTFLTRSHEANLNHLILQFGFNIIFLEQMPIQNALSGYQKWLGCQENEDAQECISHLKTNHYDWVIIDHYALGELWQNAIRPYVNFIMVIDDLANRTHDADLLLDQNYLIKTDSYEHLVPFGCNLLMGAKFALIRDEFLQYRDQSLAKIRPKNVKSLVISMGGSDPNNMSEHILQELALCSDNQFNNITLIVGEQNKHRQQLESFIQTLDLNISLKVGVTNMAQILSQTDLVIGAAGSSSWERCCLGIPTIQVVLAENQKLIADNLSSNDIAILYIKNKLCQQIKKIESQLQYFSQNASNVCDGLGTQRVIQTILNMNSNAT